MALKIIDEKRVHVWTDPADPEVKIHYLRKSPGRFLAMHERLSSRSNDSGKIENGLAYMTGFAEQVIVAWEGVFDEDGNPVPFSPDLAVPAIETMSRFVECVAKAIAGGPLGNSSGVSVSSSSPAAVTSTPAGGN